METTRMWIICALVQQGKGRVNEQQMVWFNITVCLMDNFFPFFLVDFNNCRLFYSTSEHPFFLFLRIDGWKVVYSTSENDFFSSKFFSSCPTPWNNIDGVAQVELNLNLSCDRSIKVIELRKLEPYCTFISPDASHQSLSKKSEGDFIPNWMKNGSESEKMAIRFPQSRGTLRQ